MINIIVGDQINLRALNESDSSRLLKWVNNPELKIMTGTVFPVSNLEHERWFENKITNQDEKMFGIEIIEESELIGVVGLKSINYINSNAELYIYIGNQTYFGKGYGKDAVQTIIKFAFEELNLHKVYLEVFSYNKKAQSLYEKVGFKVEGILKESLFKQGSFYDKIIMGIINNQ